MRALLLGCLLIAMVGCAEPPPEPVGNASAGTTTGLKDYVHTMARSRFAIGPSPSHYSEFGIDKVVGDYGVFGTNAKTGMVLALPNADAPSRGRPGPKYGADAHNAAVKDYFVGAGLPAEEIGPITVNTTMSAGGAGVDPLLSGSSSPTPRASRASTRACPLPTRTPGPSSMTWVRSSPSRCIGRRSRKAS